MNHRITLVSHWSIIVWTRLSFIFTRYTCLSFIFTRYTRLSFIFTRYTRLSFAFDLPLLICTDLSFIFTRLHSTAPSSHSSALVLPLVFNISNKHLSSVTVTLWKSDNPISIAQEIWKLRRLLVSMRSIPFGLTGLL